MSLTHRKLAARDPSAVRALLNLLRRYMRRYVRRSSKLQDLVQSASAEMLERLQAEPQADTQQIVRWSSYSATNALRRELRRLRRETVAYESQLHSQPAPDPAQIAAAREELERIEGLLARFGERDRRVLRAKVHGYTDAEIAEQLDSSPSAVRTVASRTRRGLRISLSAKDKAFVLRRLAELATEAHVSPLDAGSSSHG